MIITIDGPAGTGKSTVARKVAENLGWRYFDTGAMYRAVTYSLLKLGIELGDREKLLSVLENFSYDIKIDGSQKRYFCFDEDVTEKIRSQDVTRKVSEVSADPVVRNALTAIQRRFSHGGKAVFEGRDMGSVVFPTAELKVFLTARPAVRAERRYNELKGRLGSASKEEILREIEERDLLDSTREIAPLKQPEGAYLIDTSDLTIDEVVDRILTLARR